MIALRKKDEWLPGKSWPYQSDSNTSNDLVDILDQKYSTKQIAARIGNEAHIILRPLAHCGPNFTTASQDTRAPDEANSDPSVFLSQACPNVSGMWSSI